MIKFIPIEAQPYNHAVNDKRKPTAYRVEVDGKCVGSVYSESEENWRTNSSGTHRTSFRGYTRRWAADFADGKPAGNNYSRRNAAQSLIDAAKRKRKA